MKPFVWLICLRVPCCGYSGYSTHWDFSLRHRGNASALSDWSAHPGDWPADHHPELPKTRELQVGMSSSPKAPWSFGEWRLCFSLNWGYSAFRTFPLFVTLSYTISLHGKRNSSMSQITLHMTWVHEHSTLSVAENPCIKKSKFHRQRLYSFAYSLLFILGPTKACGFSSVGTPGAACVRSTTRQGSTLERVSLQGYVVMLNPDFKKRSFHVCVVCGGGIPLVSVCCDDVPRGPCTWGQYRL